MAMSFKDFFIERPIFRAFSVSRNKISYVCTEGMKCRKIWDNFP